MSTIVTVNPPDIITVTAVTENEFNITVTEPAPIAVSVSTQTGLPGATGVGTPIGGTINQSLMKKSATDYDTKWGDIIIEASNALEESAAFTAGSRIVIRTDLI